LVNLAGDRRTVPDGGKKSRVEVVARESCHVPIGSKVLPRAGAGIRDRRSVQPSKVVGEGPGYQSPPRVQSGSPRSGGRGRKPTRNVSFAVTGRSRVSPPRMARASFTVIDDVFKQRIRVPVAGVLEWFM